MLIEVTCIKWNLIGTDTGSLTDRHDADGLREGGEKRGSEGDGQRKRRKGETEGGGEAERLQIKHLCGAVHRRIKRIFYIFCVYTVLFLLPNYEKMAS